MKMVSLERRAAEAHGRGHDKPIIDLEGGQYGKYRLLKSFTQSIFPVLTTFSVNNL